MPTSSRAPVLAAGALVWRISGKHLEVLLIHRPRYDDWSWPKGKLHAGESLPAAAVREVKEETGVDVVLGVPLPQVRYRLPNGAPKVCWYWAATPARPDALAMAARPPVKACSKHEVDSASWMRAPAALKALTRKADREPLRMLMDLHADGELATTAVLLTRHGRAKKRSAWPSGDENTRPLTPQGSEQAAALVPVMSAFGAEEVISSPWARCVQTVEPYAAASTADLITAPEITEDAAKATPRGVKHLIADMLARPRPSAVVCTHRPVLPGVMAVIAERSPQRVAKELPEEDPYLHPGEMLVVHVGHRPGKRSRVVAVEQHRA